MSAGMVSTGCYNYFFSQTSVRIFLIALQTPLKPFISLSNKSFDMASGRVGHFHTFSMME